MSKYNEFDVCNTLQKKHDVRIHGKTISILRGSAAKNDLGNGSKGKVDFLARHCGYQVQWTTKF